MAVMAEAYKVSVPFPSELIEYLQRKLRILLEELVVMHSCGFSIHSFLLTILAFKLIQLQDIFSDPKPFTPNIETVHVRTDTFLHISNLFLCHVAYQSCCRMATKRAEVFSSSALFMLSYYHKSWGSVLPFLYFLLHRCNKRNLPTTVDSPLFIYKYYSKLKSLVV